MIIIVFLLLFFYMLLGNSWSPLVVRRATPLTLFSYFWKLWKLWWDQKQPNKTSAKRQKVSVLLFLIHSFVILHFYFYFLIFIYFSTILCILCIIRIIFIVHFSRAELKCSHFKCRNLFEEPSQSRLFFNRTLVYRLCMTKWKWKSCKCCPCYPAAGLLSPPDVLENSPIRYIDPVLPPRDWDLVAIWTKPDRICFPIRKAFASHTSSDSSFPPVLLVCINMSRKDVLLKAARLQTAEFVFLAAAPSKSGGSGNSQRGARYLSTAPKPSEHYSHQRPTHTHRQTLTALRLVPYMCAEDRDNTLHLLSTSLQMFFS